MKMLSEKKMKAVKFKIIPSENKVSITDFINESTPSDCLTSCDASTTNKSLKLEEIIMDFSTFLSNISDNPMKKEYLLPNIVAELLREDRINVKVLETHDKWFGVTYAEDKEYVQNAFKQLIKDGVYPEKLWK